MIYQVYSIMVYTIILQPRNVWNITEISSLDDVGGNRVNDFLIVI